MERQHVLVAGGGYAGVMCALRLAGRTDRRAVRISLVNPRPDFVERLRLHEGIAAQERLRLRSFGLAPFMGGRGVEFVQGSIASIEPDGKIAVVSDGSGRAQQIRYDRLVLATGSRPRTGHIPGAAAHAYTMTLDAERNVDALFRVLQNHTEPEVLVVGAGSTGVEVAAEIAGRRGARVTLAGSGAFGAMTSEPVARELRVELERLGVDLRENVGIERFDAGHALTPAGSIAFDICILCAGFDCAPLADMSAFETTDGGRIRTDPFLRSRRHHSIYVAGDLAVTEDAPGAPPRMSVFHALCTGAHVADNIARDLSGRKLKGFGFWTYGQAFGLGRHAVGFATFPNDRPLPPYYTGRAGYHLRRFFIWLLFQLLKLEGRVPGLPFYLRPVRPRSQAVPSGKRTDETA